ncbi:nucleoside deaminase [bacterium]|nr:nucleoside deaminase [bacterium]
MVRNANRDEYFMGLAIHEAKKALERKEVPVGALIVKEGEIIARGFNGCMNYSDPTAHAEILTIRRACKTLNNNNLSNCTLYVTLEPCIMCLKAMSLAKINVFVFGAYDSDMGAVESTWNLVNEKVFNYDVVFRGGVKEKECSELLKDFFNKIRKEQKNEKEI